MKLQIISGVLLVVVIGAIGVCIDSKDQEIKRQTLQLKARRDEHSRMCNMVRVRVQAAGMLSEIQPDVLTETLINVNGLDRLCVHLPAATIKAREAMFQRGGPDPRVLGAGVHELAVALDEAAHADWPLP